MIDRINLKSEIGETRYLLQNRYSQWYLCSDNRKTQHVIRELNEYECGFINAAIAETTQQAWVWAGGNPEISATQDELRFALETLDQIAEEADESTNPLLVFAKEVLIGAYRPEELSGAAKKAIDYFRNTK